MGIIRHSKPHQYQQRTEQNPAQAKVDAWHFTQHPLYHHRDFANTFGKEAPISSQVVKH